MTYELINNATGNTISSFESEEEARSTFERLAAETPDSDLLLVVFDAEGHAQDVLASTASQHQLA